MALSEASNTIVWLNIVQKEIGIKQGVTEIYEDNSGAKDWSTDMLGKGFSKKLHIDIKYTVIQNLDKDQVVKIIKIDKDQKAEFLTKLLNESDLQSAKHAVNMK